MRKRTIFGITGAYSNSYLIGEQWVGFDKGTLARIPAKTVHDLANRTAPGTGMLHFFIPGGSERIYVVDSAIVRE